MANYNDLLKQWIFTENNLINKFITNNDWWVDEISFSFRLIKMTRNKLLDCFPKWNFVLFYFFNFVSREFFMRPSIWRGCCLLTIICNEIQIKSHWRFTASISTEFWAIQTNFSGMNCDNFLIGINRNSLRRLISQSIRLKKSRLALLVSQSPR